MSDDLDRNAIALYAILARDYGDFIEGLGEASDSTLDTLYMMLAFWNPKHDRATMELNSVGARLVAGVISARGRTLPEPQDN